MQARGTMAENRNTSKKVRVESAIQILSSPQSSWIKTEEERAQMTIACKDGEGIPRVKNAGKTETVDGQKVQIMHNGLKVLKGGYIGGSQVEIISLLKGIHEPQEEKVFYEVLKRVRPNANMLELGSWWSYYSMWFLKEIKGATSYCCEPDPGNLKLGKANAQLNNFKLDKDIFFFHAAAGAVNNKTIPFETINSGVVDVKVRTIDSIIQESKIDLLDVLHFDIQGIELEALHGAEKSIVAGKIRFLFISTHHYSISGDPGMHQKCLDFITKHGGHIIAKHTVVESCSGDGLIVASFDKEDTNFQVEVTPQPVDDSLFRSADEDLALLWPAHNALYEYAKKLEAEEQATNARLAKREELIQEITPLRKHVKRQVKARLNSHGNGKNS
jgi:FkbM family methyltransferase